MAPPRSASLLDVIGTCVFYTTLIMALWLSRKVISWNGSWLQRRPVGVALVCSRRIEKASSTPEDLSAIQVKPRTLDDLPHVTFLELLYRLVFQGFYNRMHELQVRQHSMEDIWMSQIYMVSSSVPQWCILFSVCIQK